MLWYKIFTDYVLYLTKSFALTQIKCIFLSIYYSSANRDSLLAFLILALHLYYLAPFLLNLFHYKLSGPFHFPLQKISTSLKHLQSSSRLSSYIIPDKNRVLIYSESSSTVVETQSEVLHLVNNYFRKQPPNAAR